MKYIFERIAIIALIALSLTGCKKDYSISNDQTMLFQLQYINNEWGYQHNGFIINSDGNVLAFNNPEDWNFPDNDLNIKASLVNENIRKCKPAGKTIPKDEIRKYAGYISNIASSKVSALKNDGEDAGTTQFICYQYSENTNTYHGFVIKEEGDFKCENLNFYTKRLVTWMKDIGTAVKYY
jgi:hypothetical protein